MQLFYNPFIDEKTSGFCFDKEESKHLIRVLRYTAGDTIQITNGKGYRFTGELMNSDEKKCQIRIIKTEMVEKHWPYYLHIAIAPTKMNDRMEWFVEKATEIGVDEITPLICDRSERKEIRQDRMEKVAISAMKQSLKFTLPQINEAVTFGNFVKNNTDGIRLIAHCEERNKTTLNQLEKKEKYTVLIGPEGDFSAPEIDLALKNQFIPLSLGMSRLRTETAGVFICNAISLINS
jgi:16S rRNA (uracil1498-N3)-methyltransferase